MSFQGFQDCLVVERADGWWVVVGSESEHVASGASPEELATCISLMIKMAGLRNPSCVLAPLSESCYFARLEVGDEIDLRDRVALGYELEDHLPIDAESTVSDFVIIPAGNAASASATSLSLRESRPLRAGEGTARKPSPAATASDPPGGRVTTGYSPSQDLRHGGASSGRDRRSVAAVAVEIDRLRPFADAIESLGISVQSIVPAAVLVTRSLSIEEDATTRVDYLLVQDSWCDWVTTHSKVIVAWKRLRVDAASLRCHKLLDAVESESLVVVGGNESQHEIIRQVCGETQISPDSIDFHLLRGSELVLSNQGGRSFDLRRGELGPVDPLRPVQTQLRIATVAAAVCFLLIAVGGWWRSQRIEAEIAKVESQQRELFREAFPDARVPAALLRRVRSEHTRIMASRLTGRRSGANAMDLPVSAPDVLRQLIGALPQDVRFRITRIEVLDGEVNLDLEVRSPVDAGALATSLSTAGFDVKPPTTSRKDARTFGSSVEAEWIGPSQSGSTTDEVSVGIFVREGETG